MSGFMILLSSVGLVEGRSLQAGADPGHSAETGVILLISLMLRHRKCFQILINFNITWTLKKNRQVSKTSEIEMVVVSVADLIFCINA